MGKLKPYNFEQNRYTKIHYYSNYNVYKVAIRQHMGFRGNNRETCIVPHKTGQIASTGTKEQGSSGIF